MTQARIDPADPIPEADLLDHQAPLDPQPLTDTLIDTESASVLSDSPESLVDEADRLEQQTPVPGEDEDGYPRGPSGAGW